MSDRILGGAGLLLAILFAWQATVIQESPFSDVVGPKVFPFVVAAILAVSSLYFVLRPDASPKWPAAGRLFEILMAVAVMIAYAELLPVLGFIIATALASAYLGWRLGTRPIQAVIAGILTSGGIYLVFNVILGLSLAEGPLGF